MRSALIKKLKKILFFGFSIAILPVNVLAQELTISSGGETSAVFIPSSYIGYALISFRLILGILFLFAGMIAFRAGFNWIYWEGNAKKAHENQTTLAKALFFITILFIISSIFRWWLGGDYSSLLI